MLCEFFLTVLTSFPQNCSFKPESCEAGVSLLYWFPYCVKLGSLLPALLIHSFGHHPLPGVRKEDFILGDLYGENPELFTVRSGLLSGSEYHWSSLLIFLFHWPGLLFKALCTCVFPSPSCLCLICFGFFLFCRDISCLCLDRLGIFYFSNIERKPGLALGGG